MRRPTTSRIFGSASGSALGLALALLIPLWSGCGDEGDPVPFIDAAPERGGTITISWQIQDPGDPGATLSCEQVAASGVRLSIIPVGGGSGDVDSFSCNGGMATSREFTPGNYNVELALTAGLQRLATVTMMGATLTANSDTQLDLVSFDVTPRGNLQFQVSNSLSRPNCTAAPAGAGIDEVRIELRDGNDTCVPTTFTIDSDNAATSYASDCQNPTPVICIENDLPITAVVPSGTLELAITGLQGVEPCYSRVARFTAPGNDLVTRLPDQTLLLDELNTSCVTE